MDTKAAFEKWWKDQSEQLPPKMIAFSAWQSSRAAIEIELPGQENYDDPLSAHLAIKDCAETITSHGIRIKGKTE